MAAASPSGQKVRPIMFSARYWTLSMSFSVPPPAWKRVSDLFQPVGAFAAGDAPAAGFVLVEADGAQRELDDGDGLVEDDDAAGAEHDAGLADLVEVEADVDLVGA